MIRTCPSNLQSEMRGIRPILPSKRGTDGTNGCGPCRCSTARARGTRAFRRQRRSRSTEHAEGRSRRELASECWARVERPTFFSDLTVVAGYKRDGERHTDGLSADAYWTFSAPQTICPWCPQLDIGGWFNYLPMVGVEYDRAVRATDPTKEGSVTRGFTKLTVNVFPPRRVVEKRLTLTADVAYRYDVQSDFDGDRSHPNGEFSISYGLDPHNIFLIGADYVRGENPDEGSEGQRFVRLSLKVHFDKPQKESILKARAARARTP